MANGRLCCWCIINACIYVFCRYFYRPRLLHLARVIMRRTVKFRTALVPYIERVGIIIRQVF